RLLRDEAEGHHEPLLPGLRRRQCAQHLHRPGDRAAGQQAERVPPVPRPDELARRNFAEQYGFACADSFAQFMGADYDSNGDGQIDSDGLRYVQGESEDSYVNRLAVTLRSTIRDANVHLV